MAGKNIILYTDSNFKSPYAMSVFVVLKEKKIPFEIELINLETGENHNPGYAEYSLTRRVPTLTHGNFHLSESSAICEYLEDVFSGPEHALVYPVDLQERARARQVQAWLRSDLLPIRDERSTEVVFGSPTDQPLSKKAQVAVNKLFDAVDLLLDENGTNLFSAWSIADTDLALMLNRLVMNGDTVPEKLAAYARCQWQRGSVRQWIAMAESAE